MNRIFIIFLFSSFSLYSISPQEYYNNIAKIQLSQQNAYTGIFAPDFPSTPPNDPNNDPTDWQIDQQGNINYTGEINSSSTTPVTPVPSTTTPNFTLNNDLPHNDTGGFFGDIIGVGSIGPNGNQLYDFNATVSQSSDGDQDNDVPTLLSIRAKMEALEKETRGNKKIVKNPVFNSETNQTDWETESSSSEVTLADIHTEMQKLVLLADRPASNTIENLGDETTSTIDETLENIEENLDDFGEAMSSTLTLTNPASDHSSYYITIPSILTERVAGLPSSIDLFAIDIGGFQLPTLKEIATFVSLVVGITAVCIYGFSLKSIMFQFMRDIPKMNESNAVTNYSIAGFSIGALTMWGIQLGLIVTFFGTVFVFANGVLLESLGWESYSGIWTDIVPQMFTGLAQLSTWSDISVYWLFEFIPLISITAMIGAYFGQLFGFRVFIILGNRGIRLAS